MISHFSELWVSLLLITLICCMYIDMFWNIYYYYYYQLYIVYLFNTGWGATDRTGEQSRYPRQVDLTYNRTTDCTCPSFYFLETNVGPEGQDPCEGDSGQTERFNRNKLTINEEKTVW